MRKITSHRDENTKKVVGMKGNTMERAKLQEMGLSAEQIDEIMKENGKDIQAEKQKAEQYKSDASKVKDLQKELDEINSKNLSDVELANKAKEEALNQIKDLQNQIQTMELRTKLADKGITGENADKLIGSLMGGSLDVDLLGDIISARESAAAIAKEKEIAMGSTNPGGASSGEGKPEKTDAEKLVDSIAKSMSTNQASQDIISNYV